MKIECISEYLQIPNLSDLPNKSKLGLYNTLNDKFKITKHKTGNYPAIITINGFTTEDKENYKEWADVIDKQFPGREWFHIEWNSEKWPYSNLFTDNIRKESIKKTNLLTTLLLTNPYGRILLTSKLIVDNFWHSAVRNSKAAGIMLAKTLEACDKEFILIGHSLGARVIYNCLNFTSNKKAKINIHEIHLLGGAVATNPIYWESTSKIVKGKIYNYYSDNDYVLKSFYRLGMFTINPIGISKIDCSNVENRNLTKIIKGHTEYIQKFNTVKNYLRVNRYDIKRNAIMQNKEQKLAELEMLRDRILKEK